MRSAKFVFLLYVPYRLVSTVEQIKAILRDKRYYIGANESGVNHTNNHLWTAPHFMNYVKPFNLRHYVIR